MRNKRETFICICLILILQVIGVDARASSIVVGKQRYIVTVWGIEDGLPQNSVSAMIRTREGYTWFGTQSGLVRFDGVRFRVYNRWNTLGLKNDRILCLYEDKSGALWVGTDGGGISRLKEGKWSVYYTPAQGLSNNTVRAITGDKNNTLWIGTDNGLHRLKGKEIKVFTVEDGLSAYSVSSLKLDSGGTLWIGTIGGGINLMKNGKFLPAPPPLEHILSRAEVTTLHLDGSGPPWIGTEDGLYSQKIKKSLLPGNSIQAIYEDSSGTLWVGTDGEGIYRLTKDGRIIDSITIRQGFPDDFIHSLMEDREGNVWIGTYTAGLVRLKKSRVRTVTTGNGLPENRVQTMLRDHEGFLWIGTDRKGLSKIKGNKVIRTFTAADGLSGSKVRALFLDNGKNLWVGTTSGLNRVQITGGKFQVNAYTIDNGLSSNHITAIFQDRTGSLWIGTDNGLNRLKNGKFTSYRQEAGLSGITIRTIGENREGNLQVGTRAGLFLLKNGKFRNFAADAPVTGKPFHFDYDVLAFHEDSRGHLWVGTNGSGLIRFPQAKPGPYSVFTEKNGLPNNYIFSIGEDSRGRLWMSSYKGVFVLPAKNTFPGGPAPGPPDILTVISFDEKEGMNSSECVMTGHPSAWKTKNGTLYIPTVKGAAVFDLDRYPGNIAPAAQAPPVIIENVIADNQSISLNGRLPEHTRVVEFYFTALSFTAPDKLRIFYKLEGFNLQWQEALPQQKRMVFYVNLAPGDYCFNVIARNNEGTWNHEGARFNFRVEAPFYKRPVFYGLLLLVVGLIAGGFGRYLYSRAKKKRLEIAEKEKPEPKEKYKTSALLPETVEQVLPRLTRLMEEEKLYLDPDLTLKKLSERLQVHYNHLSRIINEHLGKSFNDYINTYRIEEAKKRLADPGEARKTVLEIAYDTGFYSKSVFNTAFKKFTGITPSQFRKEQSGGGSFLEKSPPGRRRQKKFL
jgi:ligand-binding sensor domain-containing protein/AraC-like DNA-binding protein